MAENGQLASRRKPTVTAVALDRPADGGSPAGSGAKPTPDSLGVDLATLDWQRSGSGPGSFEIAFVAAGDPGHSDGTSSAGESPRAGDADARQADWVLLRVVSDPEGRVLVYDRNEWNCFVDGAGHGEFDLREELVRARAA